MHHRVMALVLSLLCVATGAAGDGPYVELNAGPSFFEDSDFSGGTLSGETSFDPGFNVGGALGARLSEYFRVELNLSYRRADVDDVEIGSTKFSGTGDAGVFGALGNAYLDVDFGVPIKPYIGAGMGLGVVMVDSDSSANVVVVDDESIDFAWNAMGGVSFAATEHLVLSGGYRYLSTSDATLNARLVGSGPGSPSHVTAEVGMHELVLGLRYEF